MIDLHITTEKQPRKPAKVAYFGVNWHKVKSCKKQRLNNGSNVKSGNFGEKWDLMGVNGSSLIVVNLSFSKLHREL